jgi:L-lactate dehydrogenase complex protein LldG
MSTRAEFLGRIRAEMAKTPGLFAATPSVRPARPREQLDVLRRELSERWPESLARFVREFERVGGVFHRVAGVAQVPDVIASIAAEREMPGRVLASEALRLDLAGPLTGRGLQVSAMPGGGVTAAERERLRAVVAAAELGVTGADLAVAETGTLVVVSGAGRPRSTSLPACHAAVFDRDVLVESLAQAGLVLEAWHDGPEADARGAAINFITGPSRTADIS